MEVAAAAFLYEGWEEVSVSSDKGKREVHYYLKRKTKKKRDRSGNGNGAVLDLAVVGTERSSTHMSYLVVLKNNVSPPPPSFKLKSRRHVLDWLNAVVSDFDISGTQPYESLQLSSPFNNHDSSSPNVDILKDFQLPKPGHYSREFLWLGTPWICRKRRKHYQSFCRNNVKISVHEFVYVLAEEDKRLVAYLEDMYEDSKGNKMVVVRWFHKIDEVGFVWPHNFNDREIFSSLCLQDLSIECIDGRATVLSPQHFKKFMNGSKHAKLEPFVCDKLFENDDVKSFDVTRVKGYWKQEIVVYLCNASFVEKMENSSSPGDSPNVDGVCSDYDRTTSKKRHCLSLNGYAHAGSNVHHSYGDCNDGADIFSLNDTVWPFKESEQKPFQYLTVGAEVEVLSQDSGIRGCWFRASIIKRHKDKVKVRYRNILDADNESKKLEEWRLASRVAVSDQTGMRFHGRSTIRPIMPSNVGPISWLVDVGSIVDVWWHDAWREGIVIRKGSEDRIHVYFPGDEKEAVFSCTDLRHSQEWLVNKWMHLKSRPDIAKKLSHLEKKQSVPKFNETKSAQEAINYDIKSEKTEVGFSDSSSDSVSDKGKVLWVVPDLVKDAQLTQLRWKSSKKRIRGSVRIHAVDGSSESDINGSSIPRNFCISTPLKADHENCKYTGDTQFVSAAVQPLRSLLTSR